jgi:hypothetical protein
MLNVLGIPSVMYVKLYVKCFGDSVCYVCLMFSGFRLLCMLNVFGIRLLCMLNVLRIPSAMFLKCFGDSICYVC